MSDENCGIKIIRGDSFTLTVGLGPEWSETVKNAQLFIGRFVVREFQDDTAPNLLVLVGQIEPTDDPRYEPAIGLLHFEAPKFRTQSLPPYDLVCYCEIAGLGDSYTRRLFGGEVTVED